jgi:hypothetical protein
VVEEAVGLPFGAGEAAAVAGWVLERLVQPTRVSAAKANRAKMIRTGRMATYLSRERGWQWRTLLSMVGAGHSATNDRRRSNG